MQQDLKRDIVGQVIRTTMDKSQWAATSVGRWYGQKKKRKIHKDFTSPDSWGSAQDIFNNTQYVSIAYSILFSVTLVIFLFLKKCCTTNNPALMLSNWNLTHYRRPKNRTVIHKVNSRSIPFTFTSILPGMCASLIGQHKTLSDDVTLEQKWTQVNQAVGIKGLTRVIMNI